MNDTNNIEVKLNNIPEVLKQLDQWVVWREIKKEDKTKKLPVDPKTGEPASVSKPSTWGTYQEAINAYRESKFNGIGFVFTKDDPFVGIDFDDCFIDAALLPEIKQLVSQLDSYTEISPSGNGLHTIVRGKLPQGGNRHGKIEIYDTGRFFTVTGNRVFGTPGDINDRQQGIDFLLANHFPRPEKVSSNNAAIEELFHSKNGAKLKSLWQGHYQGYESQSEADLALCQILSHHFNGSVMTVDRLFRQSGLYREKWNTVHASSGKTYGEMTLEKALSMGSIKPAPKPDIPNFNCSDLGNAERLAHHYGNQLCYCHVWKKWLVWDDTKWALAK